MENTDVIVSKHEIYEDTSKGVFNIKSNPMNMLWEYG